MGRSEDGLTVPVEDGLVADAEAVAANDFPGLRIPEDQLFVTVGGVGVKLVYIHFPAGSSAVVAEGDFP